MCHTHTAEKYIGGSVERFGSCCSHGELHHPGHFSDDVLHHSPVEEHRHHCAQEHDHRQYLQRQRQRAVICRKQLNLKS